MALGLSSDPDGTGFFCCSLSSPLDGSGFFWFSSVVLCPHPLMALGSSASLSSSLLDLSSSGSLLLFSVLTP